MKAFCRLFVLLVLTLSAATSLAQSQAAQQAPQHAPRIVSPEVHADGSVTFRFRAPNAQEVMLDLEGSKPQPMQKNDQGLWTLTTAPLEPDFYGYGFVADGVALMDPSNPLMKPNLLNSQSAMHVPGPRSLPWEVNDVPHGVVHHYFYESEVVGDQRDFYVYTPPGYNPRARRKYPVLYLLHGYSDDASGWTAVGRANVIFDNLIAQGKVKPMLVVMPLGYGAPEILSRGYDAPGSEAIRQRNFDRFTQALLTEIIPQVETEYRVTKNRNARAIAGLSMGGAESLLTGLNHLDEFAWIGAFSSGGLGKDFSKDFPGLDAGANKQIRLLWVACGTEDGLIKINRQFRDWLKEKGINHTDIETLGVHSWMVWRRNLANFAPLLFR
jgi:enterochelin esterase-like enzyme